MLQTPLTAPTERPSVARASNSGVATGAGVANESDIFIGLDNAARAALLGD